MSTVRTKKYFLQTVSEFRKIMQDRRNPIETMQRAFEGLTYLYLNLPKNEFDSDVDSIYKAIFTEWSIRQALMIMAGHPTKAKKGEPIYMEA